jgi:ABC-type polysaccharide/polyol phosphate transport system ATPase subunit
MSIAINFDRVSKQFSLHHQRVRSLQELIVGLLRPSKRQKEAFWALRDVSFKVEAGNTMGIIGPNGAGKSTLLKLISRIIEPTSGNIAVHGKVGALLELGAGFHPDLTGRENIFLNGAILGLSRRQIRQKVDEIIDFAGIEQFIDTPVKHYSSGMFVRLGFAVTVHVQPDILLIDEVLAVGDQAFQQKCLNHIERLKKVGTTILLVSHNLGHIAHLCDRVLWLNNGKIQADGSATMVIDQYLAFSEGRALQEETRRLPSKGRQSDSNRWGTFQAEITRVQLLDRDDSPSTQFETGAFFRLRIHYLAHTRIESPAFGLAFYRKDGIHVNGPNSVQDGYEISHIEGNGVVDYVIERLPLNSGEYELTVAIYNRDSTLAYDHHHRLYPFSVHSPGLWHEEGIVHIDAKWGHTTKETSA